MTNFKSQIVKLFQIVGEADCQSEKSQESFKIVKPNLVKIKRNVANLKIALIYENQSEIVKVKISRFYWQIQVVKQMIASLSEKADDAKTEVLSEKADESYDCLLYTSPSPRDS